MQIEKLRDTAIEKFENVKKEVSELQSILVKLNKETDALRKDIPEKVDFEKFKIFLRRPYTIVPAKGDSWYVIVPKFIPFSVGFYDHTEGEYNYYMLNRYTQWLGEWKEIPECYDSKTRVLTLDGFKHFWDLKMDDEIATLNPLTNELEYHNPIKIIEHNYKGKMISFIGQSHDILVTPNHRMFIKRRRKRDFIFIEAQKLFEECRYKKKHLFHLKRNLIWNNSCSNKKYFEIPTITGRARNVNKISSELFLKFMGWFLSEGSASKIKKKGTNNFVYRISIGNMNQSNRKEIADIIKSIGFSPDTSSKESVMFTSKQLYLFLERFGKAGNKFIPKEIKCLPSNKLKIFLFTICKGDGTFYSNGLPESYLSKSKKLAEDVLEVALKCGIPATIGIGKSGFGKDPLYRVNFSYKRMSPLINKHPKIMDYDGKVYCVEVPNHLILIERNGKPVWCGNSIRKEVKLPDPMKITMIDGSINFEEGKEEEIRKKFGSYLTTVSKGSGKVKVGSEYDLIAEIIKTGALPFAPHPVDKKDIRQSSGKIKFEGKYAFQKEAIEKFMQYGCLSVHYMTGGGKDIISTHLLDIIKVDNLPNLYVAPNLTILEQMKKEYFPNFAPRLLAEIENKQLILSSYQNYENLKDKEYGLIIFSENHTLPANTFSKLATLRTKYRLGASASPYRNDGRTELIWALSGIPIGMAWRDIMKMLGKEYHDIYVHVLSNLNEKFKKTYELFDANKKTLIFTWRLDIGRKIAETLGIPFVSGETKNRLEIIKNNKAFVISSVGELGISIKDLEHIIEVDFLYGSLREEIQRTGRLLHSEEAKAKRHDILFTEEEFYKYGKRLRSLEEKGFLPIIMPYTSKINFKPLKISKKPRKITVRKRW